MFGYRDSYISRDKWHYWQYFRKAVQSSEIDQTLDYQAQWIVGRRVNLLPTSEKRDISLHADL